MRGISTESCEGGAGSGDGQCLGAKFLKTDIRKRAEGGGARVKTRQPHLLDRLARGARAVFESQDGHVDEPDAIDDNGVFFFVFV